MTPPPASAIPTPATVPRPLGGNSTSKKEARAQGPRGSLARGSG